MDCSTPGLPVHHQLPELFKLMSIELVMPSNYRILCHSLLLPSIFPSIRTFPVISSLHQVAKVLKLQLQHQSFQWIFRIFSEVGIYIIIIQLVTQEIMNGWKIKLHCSKLRIKNRDKVNYEEYQLHSWQCILKRVTIVIFLNNCNWKNNFMHKQKLWGIAFWAWF